MPDSETTGERSSSILREIDLLRTSVTKSIESLTAKFESMQRTLLDSYGGRISSLEQWQVRAIDDHSRMVEKIDAIPSEDAVANKIALARAEMLAEVNANLVAATTKRDDQIAEEKKAALEEMQKRDKTIERHDWVIKLVCALAGMIAVASIGAMVKYLGTAASTIDRIERLEQATPPRR